MRKLLEPAVALLQNMNRDLLKSLSRLANPLYLSCRIIHDCLSRLHQLSTDCLLSTLSHFALHCTITNSALSSCEWAQV
jgi:hypothetical protein